LIETAVTLEKGREITVEALRPYMPRALKSPVSVADSDYRTSLAPPSSVSRMLTASPRALPSYIPSVSNNGSTENVMKMLPFIAGEQHDQADDYRGREYNIKALAQSLYTRLPAKTPEQIERELMYKALVDLVREVALLRGEVADLKDAVFTQKHEAEEQEMSVVHVSPIQHAREASEQSAFKQTTLEESPLTMHEVEKRLISTALERFEGNRRQTADALGISERTLYRKLREYGLADNASPPPEE
jgi:DNA-binding protein Fis